MQVRIKENSFSAKIASYKLGKNAGLAMVWGHTILLVNISKEDFLKDKEWVCHELRHVWQVERIGKWRFLWRYIILSLRHGYYNHPYEIDARLHDNDFEMLEKVEWLP
jgi:hypothetical protein